MGGRGITLIILHVSWGEFHQLRVILIKCSYNLIKKGHKLYYKSCVSLFALQSPSLFGWLTFHCSYFTSTKNLLVSLFSTLKMASLSFTPLLGALSVLIILFTSFQNNFSHSLHLFLICSWLNYSPSLFSWYVTALVVLSILSHLFTPSCCCFHSLPVSIHLCLCCVHYLRWTLSTYPPLPQIVLHCTCLTYILLSSHVSFIPLL